MSTDSDPRDQANEGTRRLAAAGPAPPNGIPPAPPTTIPPAPPMPVPPVDGRPPPAAGADPRWVGRLSSPWRRLGAFLIDALVFLPVWFGVIYATILPRFLNDPALQRLLRPDDRPPTQGEMERILEHLQSRFSTASLVIAIGMSALTGVYAVLFIRLKGQTLGKMAVGIKVVQMLDGSLPGWGQAISRWALPAAAALVPVTGALGWLLVYLWILWDANKQGLHDKIAKTVVVRTDAL